MADKDIALENRLVRMKGPLDAKKMVLLRAEVDEGLSQIGKSDIQFISPDHDIKLSDVVGKRMSLEIDDEEGNTRYWQGYCSHCAYEGKFGGQALYRAEMRTTLWFLTLGNNCRIFQEMTPLEVIKQVLKEAKVTDIKDSTTATYGQRVYIVQYRESDFEFISRLMEEEGIYYFFTHDATKDTLVLADSSSAHKSFEHGAEKLEFHFKEDEYQRDQDHVFEWKSAEAVRTGKVSMTDYDFERPTADLMSVTPMPKGTHSFKDVEYYDYPGHHLTAEDGKTRTKVRAQGFAAEFNRSRAKGNVRWLTAGGTFTLEKHPRKEFNKEYLVVSARHKLSIETDSDKQGQAESTINTDSNASNAPAGNQKAGEEAETTPAIQTEFIVQLKAEQFRAPKVTPAPRISGLQTAIVTGTAGEEIYTDKHGRIKVQFHWDRKGNKDEKTTCFVRVMQHMSGQGWGAFHIPRIGQEVVVQFEEGNPDRPIVIGMLYNEAKKHPFDFPANMTQSGIKTNSSKGGGGFHELVFEDKKDEEFVRLQSEKDYKETIKNNAEISIGFEKMDPGDLTEKIYHHKTTEVETGDHTFKVKTGKEVREIATTRQLTVGEDETVNIGAKRTENVGSDETITIGANRVETVGADETINIGSNRVLNVGANEDISIAADQTTTIGGGYTLEVAGDIVIRAGGKITLEVGGTTVVIESSALTVESTDIALTASGSVEATGGGSATLSAGGSVEVKGADATFEGSASGKVASSGILTVQGSLVKIN